MASSAPPPITDDCRQRAFEKLRMSGTTFERAMANESQRRLIEACAASIRTADWERSQSRSRVLVRRVALDSHGNPRAWITQVIHINFEPVVQPDLLT